MKLQDRISHHRPALQLTIKQNNLGDWLYAHHCRVFPQRIIFMARVQQKRYSLRSQLELAV
jgi:hypothetical protein